jgi:2-amino-4-hydroxy-6-hydroxymethyldihydropteridine diphosphokinase
MATVEGGGLELTAESISLVALGSNLGDSKAVLLEVMDRLEEHSSRPLLRSSLYRTAPVDCPPDSPDFLNAVVGLAPLPWETSESLFLKLQDLEREFGRRPKRVMNEARPLDLDLISFGQEQRDGGELILPHPRAHRRAFVLAPITEILPGFRLPGQSNPVSVLLQKLESPDPVERLS